jgi:hypothetical protein
MVQRQTQAQAERLDGVNHRALVGDDREVHAGRAERDGGEVDDQGRWLEVEFLVDASGEPVDGGDVQFADDGQQGVLGGGGDRQVRW